MKLSKTCTQSQCSGTILACPWGSQSVPGFSFVLLWVTACPGSPNTNNQWDTDVCFHLLGKNQPRSESGLYLVRRKDRSGCFCKSDTLSDLCHVWPLWPYNTNTATTPDATIILNNINIHSSFCVVKFIVILRMYGKTMKFNVTIEQRYKEFILP